MAVGTGMRCWIGATCRTVSVCVYRRDEIPHPVAKWATWPLELKPVAARRSAFSIGVPQLLAPVSNQPHGLRPGSVSPCPPLAHGLGFGFKQ
jgi:hypothetical protein